MRHPTRAVTTPLSACALLAAAACAAPAPSPSRIEPGPGTVIAAPISAAEVTPRRERVHLSAWFLFFERSHARALGIADAPMPLESSTAAELVAACRRGDGRAGLRGARVTAVAPAGELVHLGSLQTVAGGFFEATDPLMEIVVPGVILAVRPVPEDSPRHGWLRLEVQPARFDQRGLLPRATSAELDRTRRTARLALETPAELGETTAVVLPSGDAVLLPMGEIERTAPPGADWDLFALLAARIEDAP